MAHIFISYSRKNTAYTRKLAEHIRKAGFNVWIDDRIDYGERWWRTIVSAIEDCAAFVVVMSPDAEQSEWVEREILVAQRAQKPIFPLLLEGREFALLITTQFVDVTDGGLPPDDFLRRLQAVTQPGKDSGVFVAPSADAVEAEPPAKRGWMVYAAVILVVAVLAVVGLLALNGGNRDNSTETPTQTDAQSIAQGPPTLSDFDRLQTAQAYQTEAAEIQRNFDLTATEEGRLAQDATATAAQIEATNASARETMTALANPTARPSNTPVPPTATTISDPLQVALTPVTSNTDWTPVEREFDGVMMVLVPAGCFMMGSEDGDDDEQPVHEICFDEPFWIDKYEVTNEQYGSVGCDTYSSEPDQPRNCVTWFEARDFCEARGGNLPTEAQWEYAARGPSAWVYPWEGGYDASLVIGGDDPTYGFTSTAPVGSRPGGESWVGAMDMSGNVWEWTSSLYLDYPYGADHESNTDTISRRVLRGGSFFNFQSNLRGADRFTDYPSYNSVSVGFRCVRPPSLDSDH